MSTLLVTHPIFLEHDTGPDHPECIKRLEVILKEFDRPIYEKLVRLDAPLVTRDQVNRVHDEFYMERILAQIPFSGTVELDGDTYVSPASGEAAQRAAGALCLAVEQVMSGSVNRAFCAVRPPGHHAEPAQSMGFCLFNNAMIGAAHARKKYNARVAIVDFDVHHGNGSSTMVKSLEDCIYFSIHQHPLYPGSGSRQENIPGVICNIPVPPHSDREILEPSFSQVLLPALYQFMPDLIIISAGFDAHAHDPLAECDYQDEDFFWMTEQLVRTAKNLCEGRIVSTLEGGYNLDALARSCGLHMQALMVD